MLHNVDDPFSFIRAQRHRLLVESDWTVLPDSPLDQQAWAKYRQELRDLPQKYDDPTKVVWPTPPA